MHNRIRAMTTRTRLLVMFSMMILSLLIVNIEIIGKERIVRDGLTVHLRIAPRDPRSLMQGDYMALRYTMAEIVARDAGQFDVDNGMAIVTVDNDGEARYEALYDGRMLREDQSLLRYRKRGDSVRIASDAYFFEEGSWELYRAAVFGELRVNASGEAVLTGLLDDQGKRLGVSLH